MDKCFKCGVSGDKALLFSAVSEKGIVKICRKCSFEEDIPIMKYVREEFEKRPTVHERLSRLSGIEIKNNEDKISIQISNVKDESLMKLANENFRKNVLDKNPFGMVDHFHWIIMRARRSKKLNQKQFAEAIEESEEAIKMAEKGILPKKNFVLVSKIENYLGIRIKNEFTPRGVHSVEMEIDTSEKNSFEKDVEKIKETFFQSVKEDKVKFDETTTRTLTISDLQKGKQKKEEEILAPEGVPPDMQDGIFGGKKPEKINLDKEDLSQEEIDRILFGK